MKTKTKKRILSGTKYAFFLGALGFLLYLFYPRTYAVLAHEKNASTKYWKLSTGSMIGYVLIEGKGPKKASPILYLHGGPGGVITKNILNMLTPFSEEGYTIYAYDQIGSGSSERVENIEDYTVERHVSDLEEIITRIEAEKVILIGQSWGSVLATFFVTKRPDKVDRIVMIGPGPIFPINKRVSNLKAPDSLHLKAPVFSNKDGNKAVYTFRHKCVEWYAYAAGGKLISDKEADDFFTHLNNYLNRSMVQDTALIEASSGGGGYYAHIMTLKSLMNVLSPREKMKGIKTPILIMKGQYGNQKWGFTQEYLELFEKAQLKIIPKAGHAIYKEQPELYQKEILNFLRNTTSNRLME
ncbi:MAG: alpha/beta fold hydrolase [Aureispira sp.]